MDVSVVVGTFGSRGWQERGARAAAETRETHGVDACHAHRETLAQARNFGASQSSTEWLAFLDADDALAGGYFDAMEGGSADLRAPAVLKVFSRRSIGPECAEPCDLREGNYLPIGTLIRREMFLRLGGFREWPLFEDWDLWQRCFIAGASIEQIPTAVYIARKLPGSRSRSPSARSQLDATFDAIRRANFPELFEETP